MVDIVTNISLLLKKQGMTWKQLGEKSGVSYAGLMDLKRTGNPTLKIVNKIATALGLDEAGLLDSRNIITESAKESLGKHIAQLQELYEKL